MWVTVAIYLSVIGWAYAIGSLLSLGQDRGFRAALASQRFGRRVARLREPFLLLAGYGQSGQIVGQALDADGRRFTVVDLAQDRVDTWTSSRSAPTSPVWPATPASPRTSSVPGSRTPAAPASWP